MTSNRRQALQQPMSNPATKFLSWKSNDKCFSYFDKEIAESLKGQDDDVIKAKANVAVPLPFKFLFLDELASVKGWSDSLTGQIISNEVKFISKEVLTAKCYHKNIKGEKTSTEIAKGLYKDIKDKVNSAGAKYHKSVYVMLEDGTLANIQMKGACVAKWGEFTQKTKSRLADEWIVVEKAIDGKKGAVKFTTPEFKFLKSTTEDENNQADECFNELETYLKTYLVKSEPIIDEIEVVDEEIVDDLDF
jgi:hypothetical protein